MSAKIIKIANRKQKIVNFFKIYRFFLGYLKDFCYFCQQINNPLKRNCLSIKALLHSKIERI